MFVICHSNVNAREFEEANTVYGPFSTWEEAKANLIAVVCLHNSWKVVSERDEPHPHLKGWKTRFVTCEDESEDEQVIEILIDNAGNFDVATIYNMEEAAVIEAVRSPVNTK